MDSMYFRGFVNKAYLRNSCHQCAFKTFHRVSDITLADAWGIQYYCPSMNDNKGTSLILVHTRKGSEILNSIPSLSYKKVDDVNIPIKCNPSITRSVSKPNFIRSWFFILFNIFNFTVASYFVDIVVSLQNIIRKIKRKLHIS